MYTKYTGFILKKHPLGEADELLTLFTKQTGKLRVKTVGSRKIKSKLAGHLQTLNEIDFETAGKSGRLPVLISVRVETLSSYLRENLEKFAWALVATETIYRITPDGEVNEKAYNAVQQLLYRLDTNADARSLVRKFQLDLLSIMGFAFPSEECVTCRGQIVDSAFFSPSVGGLMCQSCQPANGTYIRLNAADMRFLKDLLVEKGVRRQNMPRPVEKVVEGFLKYILEREIQSTNFINSL